MESELPRLITDLALILVLAGVVTVVFRKLRQPLVLGYIVAGFLASPYMPYTPSIGDEHSIEVWSKIGVIFLMFALGLEFSFKKILKNGLSPLLTCAFIMCGMMALGCAVGKLLGMNTTNCLYLGGMLCVSSTTIIYKAFADLGLGEKQFAGNVIAVLVLEDIFAIVLMAFLSSFSLGRELAAMDVLMIVSRLVFFLLLWFIVGVWLIPTLLRRYALYINKETLTVVSIGLCLLMVVIANRLGYGAELGAFVMGSILAETLEAERINAAVDSVKDLFGAVFFVSVGMMVEPMQLVSHWGVILLLVGVVVIGNIVFDSIGYLLFGSSLRDALQSSFSMVQIGEFSFIIAAMGVALGVVEDYVYPTVVAVSIITTFLTPYSISLAMRLPLPRGRRLARRKEAEVVEQPLDLRRAWRGYLRNSLVYAVVYGILCMSVVRLLFVSLLLLCRSLFGHWPGNAVCGVLTLFLLSLFLRPIVLSNTGREESHYIRAQGGLQAALFSLTLLVRYAVAVYVVYYIFDFLSPLWWPVHVALSVVVVMFILRSRHIKRLSKLMEQTFLYNLSRRDEVMPKEGEGLNYARRLRGRDLHVTQLRLPARSQWGGRTLGELGLSRRCGVVVTAIVRDHERLNIPGGREMLFPQDVVEVAGDDRGIGEMKRLMLTEVEEEGRGARGSGVMTLRMMRVGAGSALCGCRIRESGIREEFACLVIGKEEEDGSLSTVSPEDVVSEGDRLWVAGEYDDVVRLKSAVS